MHTQRQIDHLQARRASEWLEILRQGKPEDLAEFREWCRKSPLHIQEFLEITCTDRALDELSYQHDQSSAELLALLKNTAETPLALPLPSRSPATDLQIRSRRRHRWQWGLAASVAAAVLGLAVYQPWQPAREFSTKVGEQRIVELTDHSVVTLNTNSDIKIDFNENTRQIELNRGEAVFKVAHDPQRPFQVRTRVGTVQAIGTEFNIYDRADGIDVTVLEGRVRLMALNGDDPLAAQTELAAGERARIALDGSVQRTPANIERVTAWSKRRLKFHNEPLEEIVLEFNRYHRDLQLRMEGIPAGSRHYSGIFDADDPETLARFLRREPELLVERRDGEIVIRQR